MKHDDLLAALAAPGLHVVVGCAWAIVVEIEADGTCHQLKPRTLERDGILSRDGWTAATIVGVLGPFSRSTAAAVNADTEACRCTKRDSWRCASAAGLRCIACLCACHRRQATTVQPATPPARAGSVEGGDAERRLAALISALKTHSGDSDGGQFGLGWVKFNEQGQVASFLWATQREIDKAIEAALVAGEEGGAT